MSTSLRPAYRKRPELNLVPLIDVLVMLVFFAFVTMQFRTPSISNIMLPQIETAGKNTISDTVILGVDKDGVVSFSVGGKQPDIIKMEELSGVLSRVYEMNRDGVVLIRADETTELKTLAYIMDSCRKAGLNKFNLQGR